MVGGGLAWMLMWLQELYLPMSDEWNSTTSSLAITPFWLILNSHMPLNFGEHEKKNNTEKYPEQFLNYQIE